MSTTLQDVQEQFDQDMSTSNASTMQAPSVIRIIISCATGLLFGIALEKGRVFEPQVIRDQLLLRRFGMLKMFLSASAVGMISFSFLYGMPHTMRKMGLAIQNFPEKPLVKTGLGVLIGAALLGSGMAISGACPGTSIVQLGAGVENAYITILGGLFGSLAYAMTHADLFSTYKTKLLPKYSMLHKYLELPYSSIAIPLSCVLAGAVFGLEVFSPWHKEIDSSLVTEGIMKAGAWPPFIAGMIIGTLQVPIVLTNEDTLGSASAYVTILSYLWPSPYINFNNEEDYLKKYRSGPGNWWQVLYMTSAMVGGALSATASGTIGTVPGLPWYHAFGGGFLMLFGARLAGGCTSGHGLSGFGLLSLTSFIAVPAMFGSGIATAFFMKYVVGVEM